MATCKVIGFSGVGVLDALDEARLELLDQVVLDAADEADLLGLGLEALESSLVHRRVSFWNGRLVDLGNVAFLEAVHGHADKLGHVVLDQQVDRTQ